jgi:hypothetical protein
MCNFKRDIIANFTNTYFILSFLVKFIFSLLNLNEIYSMQILQWARLNN